MIVCGGGCHLVGLCISYIEVKYLVEDYYYYYY